MVEKAWIEFKDIVTDSGDGTVFYVPFNPTELIFEAGSEKDEEKKTGARGMNVRLRMKLIFDKSLEMESVQEDTQRFLSAARDPLKRRVLFQWNKIFFDGLLERMSAVYEMFTEDGNPVRARVDLTIAGRSGSMAEEEWYKDYRELFFSKRLDKC